MFGRARAEAQTALVVGLGNPGPRYATTRHNAGFMVVEELARRHGVGLVKSGHQSIWGKGLVEGRPVIAALPQTYMNLSGEAVAALLSYYRLPPTQLVVAHDDLDLELGRLKVAARGGAAGHKGVGSIISLLGTDEFARLRFGVGRPRHDEPIEQFVLNGFYADQRELGQKMVQVAADCLEVILGKGLAEAMQRFHRPFSN
ncbi:peptidyl-tRNA hydrolase [Desulfarculus baarsii DSM 2075]|uniref:Peptidyl-tRNA hydrolase n=1 Tax=Desulfarculus baarsii (strain ATCC 33931 / DSM 2075 / LMG 7858 / VKM B-1802 / 2st14) TaxID=644282 RepID=E1QEW5_DESB2|nr:aminoacyl-tRNA hydrolase [Desulfarculus baarsii]ADK84101.1 peptidyl-tRNA hydrolase [Desulfarculus baarsii DSM 2075]